MIDWLETIPNEKLRSDVKKNILVSGGCITSLFQGLPVNDYDVYIQDMDVLIRLAQHYYPGTTTQVLIKCLTEENVRTILTIYRALLKLTITNLKKQFATKHLN
jgi:hypothetical protein